MESVDSATISFFIGAWEAIRDINIFEDIVVSVVASEDAMAAGLGGSATCHVAADCRDGCRSIVGLRHFIIHRLDRRFYLKLRLTDACHFDFMASKCIPLVSLASILKHGFLQDQLVLFVF